MADKPKEKSGDWSYRRRLGKLLLQANDRSAHQGNAKVAADLVMEESGLQLYKERAICFYMMRATLVKIGDEVIPKPPTSDDGTPEFEPNFGRTRQSEYCQQVMYQLWERDRRALFIPMLDRYLNIDDPIMTREYLQDAYNDLKKTKDGLEATMSLVQQLIAHWKDPI